MHALLEVVERDVLYRDGQSGGQQRTLIDPGRSRTLRPGDRRPADGRGDGGGTGPR
ncbi:hypothetical protein ACR6C2_07395 [Streptomyces sp. INA 01156]